MLDETSTFLRMNEASESASCSNSPMNLSFRVMVQLKLKKSPTLFSVDNNYICFASSGFPADPRYTITESILTAEKQFTLR